MGLEEKLLHWYEFCIHNLIRTLFAHWKCHIYMQFHQECASIVTFQNYSLDASSAAAAAAAFSFCSCAADDAAASEMPPVFCLDAAGGWLRLRLAWVICVDSRSRDMGFSLVSAIDSAPTNRPRRLYDLQTYHYICQICYYITCFEVSQRWTSFMEDEWKLNYSCI